MNEAASSVIITCVVVGGVLTLILLFALSNLGRSSKNGPSGRIPPPQSFYLDQEEAMARVRNILAEKALLNCRWRITYDRAGEGRLQARVYGTPIGATGSEPVDILLNMLFHRLEARATELEWSYVVMSGKAEDADLLVDESNRHFLQSLTDGQAGQTSIKTS